MSLACGSCRRVQPQMAYYTRRVRRVSLRGLGQDTAQSPPGSRLAYNVAWPGGAVIETSADIRSIVTSAISAQGLQVTSGSDNTGFWNLYTSNPGFSLTVLDLVGHARVDDVRLVIDHAVYNAGRTPTSTIALISTQPAPTTPTDPVTGLPIPPAAPATQGFGDWLSANWGYVALAVGGIFVAREVL